GYFRQLAEDEVFRREAVDAEVLEDDAPARGAPPRREPRRERVTRSRSGADGEGVAERQVADLARLLAARASRAARGAGGDQDEHERGAADPHGRTSQNPGSSAKASRNA